jgi:phospholipid/cholesterol/gamma-HCH transport system substrate-binding protein
MDRASLALRLRIGAFVVVALAVFLGIIYLLGAQARYFERKYDLVAEFPEVGGLIDGATVRLAGVQIGRVTDVRLAPEVGGKVRVTLTVARRFMDRIRKNSEARIVTQGLLGDKLVEISPGSPEYPPLKPGDVIATQEPVETSRIFSEAARTLVTVNRLATSVQGMVEKLEKGGTAENLAATVESARRVAAQLEGMGKDGTYGELAATVRSARRITEEVEKGKGLLHALVYDEPETLRRLNALLGSAQDVLARTRDGQSAVGVLLAPDSARAGRSLVTAMEALGRGADKAGPEGGLLSALLYDPQYKTVAADLQVVARNFRDVSERLAKGQGLLGGLLVDRGDGPMGEAGTDFARAMANLRVITDRLRAGEGTIGGLLEDPTVYENLAAFLEGAQRSFLLRALIRSSIGSGPATGAGAGSASPGGASPGSAPSGGAAGTGKR